MKIRVNSFIIIFSMGSRKCHFLYVVVSKMPLLVYTDIFLVWVGQILAVFGVSGSNFGHFWVLDISVCGSLKNVLLYEGL